MRRNLLQEAIKNRTNFSERGLPSYSVKVDHLSPLLSLLKESVTIRKECLDKFKVPNNNSDFVHVLFKYFKVIRVHTFKKLLISFFTVDPTSCYRILLEDTVFYSIYNILFIDIGSRKVPILSYSRRILGLNYRGLEYLTSQHQKMISNELINLVIQEGGEVIQIPEDSIIWNTCSKAEPDPLTTIDRVNIIKHISDEYYRSRE